MGFNEILIKNTVFKERITNVAGVAVVPDYTAPQGTLLERLHGNPNIHEKAFGEDGRYSSFNFTRDAFNNGTWNDETIKARGLFIDNKSNRVVARGFEKFFGYKERQFNTDEFLKQNLVYPVTAYTKYNGFLGILGYGDEGLLFCSKSTIDGEFAEYFKTIFKDGGYDEEKLLKYMRENNVGLVFEVIDPVNDPHIVEYDKSEIILLDVISLQEKWKDLPYDELVAFGKDFGFKVKEKFREFNDWETLHEFLNQVAGDTKTRIEGYVMVDAQGYQFKLKGAWYRKWKDLRTFKQQIGNGHGIKKFSSVQSPLKIAFIGWAVKKGKDYCAERSIIQLRNEFEKEHVFTETKED